MKETAITGLLLVIASIFLSMGLSHKEGRLSNYGFAILYYVLTAVTAFLV